MNINENASSTHIEGLQRFVVENGCDVGFAYDGDGILTSLKMMQVMIARKKKMSELSDGFTMYPQVLENVRVNDKKAAQDDVEVRAAIKEVEETLGDKVRILVRESGTEPVVRVMVEAETTEVCQEMVNKVVEVMKRKGL